MSEPLIITLADVKTKGLAAYKAKALSAQGPTPACNYRDPSGRPCIVGAALPDDLAMDLEQTVPFCGLRGVVNVEDTDEQREIENLQRIHDAWAALMSDRPDKEQIAWSTIRQVPGHKLTEVTTTAANVEKLLVERLSCN